jgi:hypothetical protein
MPVSLAQAPLSWLELIEHTQKNFTSSLFKVAFAGVGPKSDEDWNPKYESFF